VGLGNRGWPAVFRAPLQAGHYRALSRMVARYPTFPRELWRYLTGRGSYPYSPAVRTPTGRARPQLDTSHDLSTLNEIFCREDYGCGSDIRVAVDIGANVGMASLYFLTRSADSRSYLFEPDPKNTARISRTLRGYEGRYQVQQVAIGLVDGAATFGVEPIGRYGSLRPEVVPGLASSITVEVRTINAVLREVLHDTERIDVLKIDIEGGEAELVAAIEPEILARIDTIYFETDESTPLHADTFDHHFANQTNRLRRRR
jgi:FkbM family methyltransferase